MNNYVNNSYKQLAEAVKGKNYTRLAKEIGISRGLLYKAINGEPINTESTDKLSKFFGITLESVHEQLREHIATPTNLKEEVIALTKTVHALKGQLMIAEDNIQTMRKELLQLQRDFMNAKNGIG